jgi:hypothetical protein
MIPFPKNYKIGNYKSIESTFRRIKMIILSDGGDKQIFHMKDGKYILEVVDMDSCEYYFSYDLNDLI